MKHMLSMMGNASISKKKPARVGRGFSGNYRTKYLAYKINGYWFYLSCTMWAEWRGVKKVTMLGRIDAGRSLAVALGFEPMPERKNKKGRPMDGHLSNRGKNND